MSFPVSYNLYPAKALLASGPDLGMFGDSFMVGEVSGHARFPDQIMLGVPMADINGVCADADENNLKIVQTLIRNIVTNDVSGTNAEEINALNVYRLNGTSGSTDYWAVPVGNGQAIKFDDNGASSLTLGPVSRIMSVQLKTAATSGTMNWGGGVNTINVIGDIDANGFKFRTIHVPVDSGTVSSRLLYINDGTTARWGPSGSQGADQRFNSKNRGKWHLGENPESTSVVADYGHANAIQDTIVKSSLGGTQFYYVYDEAFTTSSQPKTDDSINIMNTLVFRVDANGDPIAGTIPFMLSDSSWNVGGFGADTASTTGLKTFSEDQITHWIDCKVVDRSRKSLYFWCFDPESRTASQMKADCLAAMEVFDNAHDSVAIPRAFHVWIGPHRNSNDTNSQATNQGYYDAVVEHGYSGFFSIYQATDGIYFDNNGSDETTWLSSNVPGHDSFSFGSVSSVDLTSGALLSDGLHTTENGAALFINLMNKEIQSASTSTNAALLRRGARRRRRWHK